MYSKHKPQDWIIMMLQRKEHMQTNLLGVHHCYCLMRWTSHVISQDSCPITSIHVYVVLSFCLFKFFWHDTLVKMKQECVFFFKYNYLFSPYSTILIIDLFSESTIIVHIIPGDEIFKSSSTTKRTVSVQTWQ